MLYQDRYQVPDSFLCKTNEFFILPLSAIRLHIIK